MVTKSRWKAAHDRFPAHVEEAKNSDGAVHRGYHMLEFRVAAELLRIGPVHSPEDYWAPSDWQLLLVVSEYMSALLEFLDWFWPDLGWEHHKQAIVLSKRLLQPRSPFTYPDLQIDPQLRAAWQSFTYCFWHGTRHLPTTAPPGDPPALYTAARDWMTKLVGERGFEIDGHISSSLQSWVQSTQPRLREAFPGVDWSRWPSVVWPDPECAFRAVEKRGALKRRQQEEDYAVRWPLRVTQGRPKFNHLKMEARDGFVVGIPSIKNPPALGFLAISDVMCAFKQATQSWPPAVPLSPSYAAQQDVVQSFVQNVLRETRGPLAPGIAHEQYKYLGYVACCALGWQSALLHLAVPLRETSAWGPQSLVLPGGSAAPLPDPIRAAGGQGPLGLGLGLGLAGLGGLGGLGMSQLGGLGLGTVDLGLAAQLAHLQPRLLPSADLVEASQPQSHATRTRPSPFLARQAAAGAGGARRAPGTSSLSQPQPQPGPSTEPAAQAQAQAGTGTGAGTGAPHKTQIEGHQAGAAGGGGGDRPTGQPEAAFDGTAPMSLGGLSSMQDLIDGLPSQADLSWSAILGAVADEEAAGAAATAAAGAAAGVGGAAAGPGPAGASQGIGTLGTALTSFSQIMLPPGWPSLRPPQPLALQTGAQGPAAGMSAPAAGPSGLSALPGLAAGALGTSAGMAEPLGSLRIPSPTGLSAGLSGLNPYDSGLPCGTLQYPMCSFGGVLPPPRTAPDAPVIVQPPGRAGSPFQGTITNTTGSLTNPAGLLGGAFPRAEPAAQEPQLARRSHGEVFTLSPVTSCGPTGETLPSSPAMADSAGAGAGAGPSGRRSQEGLAVAGQHRSREAQQPHAGGRRTRQDVAAAAAAAAADAGLPPAPGSLVERSAKRPNAQVGSGGVKAAPAATAERVESLGAFLTDQQAGLAAGTREAAREPACAGAAPGSHADTAGREQQGVERQGAQSPDTSRAQAQRELLSKQLLALLRSWAEGARAAGAGSGEMSAAAPDAAAAAAEVRRRVAELLEQGAPADAAEEVAAAAATGRGAGYTALHWACLRGDRALAELLIHHGADPDQRDAAGVPARLANPGFATAVAELVARERKRAATAPKTPTALEAGVHLAAGGSATAPAAGLPPGVVGSVAPAPAAGTAPALAFSSAFAAANAASAAAAAAAGGAAAAVQPPSLPGAQGGPAGQLCQHLVALLARADQLAGQLAQHDPEGASRAVLDAFQSSAYLSQLISPEGSKQQQQGSEPR